MSTSQPIPEDQLDRSVRHDWSKIYGLCCKELGIQQEKRDQVINLYLMLCGILVPFTYQSDNLDNLSRGLIFLFAAVVGFLFTSIVIRYRIYKEVHWITCSTITKLPYLVNVTKENVQKIFKDTMALKAKSFTDEKGVPNYRRFRKKNRSSAETYSYMVLVLLTSIMLGLSLYLLLAPEDKPVCWIPIAVAVLASLVTFWIRMRSYMRKLYSVYECLGKDDDEAKESFNSNFEKAWFLHVYYDD